MANVDAYTGFQPIGHFGGGLVRTEMFKIASGYSSNIFTGDPVILTAGRVEVAAASSTTLIGVFAGCEFLDSSGVPGGRWSPYWPASTTTTGSVAATAYIWADPMIVFRCQSDTTTAYVETTHLGTFVDLIATHAGSTTTGLSGMEADLSAVGDAQMVVLGLVDEVGNAAGVNAKLRVMFRRNIFKLSAAP